MANSFKLRMAILLAVVALCPSRALPAPANEESPLAIVPAHSAIVVYVKGYERTKERLITMVKNAIPDLAAKAEAAINDGIKQGLEGREFKGLEKEGPIFLVFPEVPKSVEDKPTIVAIFRVSKYADFRDAILKEDERQTLKVDPAGFEEARVDGQPLYLVDLKEYAVISDNKDAAVAYKMKRDGLDTVLEKGLAKKFGERDVAVYVNVAAINKEFRDSIKKTHDELDQNLDEIAGQFGDASKGNIEIFKALVKPVFQAFEDCTAFVATADFRPEGFAFGTVSYFGKETKTANWLKDSKPTAFTSLNQLLTDKSVYLAMELPPALQKAVAPFIHGIVGNPSGEKAKALADAITQVSGAGPKNYLAAMDLPFQGLMSWAYADPVQAATAQLKLFESLQEGESFSSTVLKEKPKVKASALKYREFDIHSVNLEFDIPATVDKALPQGLPIGGVKDQMTEMMKKMIGERRSIWFGTDGKQFLQVVAQNWDEAKEAIDRYLDKKKTIGETAPFKDTRKQLPPESSFITLVDIPKYATFMAQAYEPFLSLIPVPLPPGLLKPAMPGKTTFLGLSFTLRPQKAEFDLWVPGKGANEIYKMFVEKALSGG